MRMRVKLGAALIFLAAAAPAGAATLVAKPDQVRIDEHLGAATPGTALYTDTEGRTKPLAAWLGGDKPVVLVLAYERCPMLCGLVLHSAGVAVKATGLQLGRDFRAVTVSFDPAERADAAKEKQATLLDLIGRGARADDWPFLHGDRKAIDAITDATGFYYYRDPLSGEFAHLAALIVLTPDGRVSRYLYGVGFTGRDLRLALVEAGQGQTGSAFERILLKCYRFDGTTHRYELAIRNYMRAGGAAIGLAVAIFLAKLWRRERRRAE